ncbi:MAG: hypothetical protein L6Q34_07725 [Nitrospira sp.]|nr:hypothetical protein [Nitrospira sp.]
MARRTTPESNKKPGAQSGRKSSAEAGSHPPLHDADNAPARRPARNWVAYLCETLAASGLMPTWEAATYLTDNLFGDKPNLRLLHTASPHEDTINLLQRLYQPLVEAATREVSLPSAAKIHVFTDVSLTGNSAVLVVYLAGEESLPQLLLLDAVKAWDLVFENADRFNDWAEGRYRMLRTALADLVDSADSTPLPYAS